MVCRPSCPLEDVQFHQASLGPVSNDERICRAAYGKKAHYNAAGIRPTFLRDKDLMAGNLSVWRYRNGPGELDNLVGILGGYAPPSNKLWDVAVALAGTIRAIRVSEHPNDQVLHIVDDCRIDDNGGTDPSHATIGICQGFTPLDKGSPLYIEIRDKLFQHFMQSARLWSLPQAQRV